jgi:predicted permease
MGWNDVVEVPDAPRPGASDRELVSWFNAVSPGWFATLGAPIRVGRDFDARDRPGAPLAAIVNEAFAAKRLPPGNPLGHQLRLTMHDVGEADKVFTVVGVAGNMPYNKIQQSTEPIVFVVMEQNQDEHMPPAVLNVRAAGGQAPDLLVRSLTAAITGVDRDLALTFRPLRDQVNASLVRERIMALLSGFFGGLALLLAAIGLYGVASYSVSLRRTEIGIRMALGANALNVQRTVLARVAVLVGIGVALGAVASYWASRLVASLLFGLAPGDLPTIIVAALLLMAVAIVAAWLPARRAARIDPAVVLRQ